MKEIFDDNYRQKTVILHMIYEKLRVINILILIIIDKYCVIKVTFFLIKEA